MDGVESPQRAALSKVSGTLRDLRRQLDHDEMSEIAIECGNSTSERRACHARLAPTARERGPRFGIRDTRGRSHGGSVEWGPRLVRSGLAHVELHQRARVEIQDQRRSSTTASETERPRMRGALWRPTGLPPAHAIRPLFTSVRTTASVPSPAPAGTMTATGRFRSVTVITSPRRTRASVALNLSLSCRTPICVFATTSRSARPG